MATPNPIKFSYDSVEWRVASGQARMRAGGRCQGCGGRNPRNHVHHISPVRMAPHLALDPGNLTVLCPGCHDSVHHVARSRALLAMVHIARDWSFLAARRLDAGPPPLQEAFAFDFPDAGAANDDEWTLDPPIAISES